MHRVLLSARLPFPFSLAVICALAVSLVACGEAADSGSSGSGSDVPGGPPGFQFDGGGEGNPQEGDTQTGEKPDGGSQVGDDTGGGGGPDTGTDTSNGPVGELQFVQEFGDDGESCVDEIECNISMVFTSDRTLAVRYVKEGEPVGNALIRFSLASDDAMEALNVSPNAAFTASNGHAATLVAVANNFPGVYKLVARVDDDPNVLPIRFVITLGSKLGPPLIVRFKKEYPDPVTFTSIETTAYKKTANQQYACNSIELLAKLPPGGLGLPLVQKVTDIIELPTMPGLADEGSQSWTIVALGKTSSGGIRVLGCNDHSGNLVFGQSTTVIVPLREAPPNYTGCYDVVTNLDLTSALPPQIKAIFDVIFAFFESPTGGLAMLSCVLGKQFNVGVLNDLCGYVFANPNDPKVGQWSSTWANIIIQVVDGLLLNLINSQPVAKDIFYTGKDVSKILTGLELRGQIQMKPLPLSGLTIAVPDSNGFFKESQCSQTWDEVRFKWTLNTGCDPNDESCGWIALNFSQFSNAAIAISNFEARVEPTFYDMNVFPHSINFKYGKLLNAIIKSFMLPQIFGDGSDGYPKIDTYEEVLKVFMCGKPGLMPGQDCCEIFAGNIAGSGGGFISDTIEFACNALVPLGSAFIDGLLDDLDLDSDNLMVETAVPCTLEDNDADGLIDNWGRKTSPCTWAIGLDLFGLNLDFDATFYAVRGTCN